MYDQTGNMLYRKMDDQGRPTGDPMREIENGMARDVLTHVQLINFQLGLMRDASGINEVMDASTPDPDMLKGVAELAMQGTNNALKGLYTARKFLFTETAYSLTLRLQEAVKNREIKGWATALGKTDARFIEVNEDISLHEYGFKVEDVPTDKEWMMFEAQLKQALDKEQITIDQYYTVESIQNMKLAKEYLQLAVKKNRDAAQLAQQQALTINAEEQRKTKAESVQADMQKTTHETDEKIRLEAFKAQMQKEADYRQFAHENSMATKKHHIDGDLKHVDERISQRSATPKPIEPVPPSGPGMTGSDQPIVE